MWTKCFRLFVIANILLIGLFIYPKPYAQEAIYDDSEESDVRLNSAMRRTNRRLLHLEGTIDINDRTSGILTVDRGGTGQDLSTNTQGAVWFDNGTNEFTRLNPGTDGYFLKTQGSGADVVWEENTYSFSNVIYTETEEHIVDGGSGYVAVGYFRFKKIEGISNVAIHARMHSKSLEANKEAFCKVDIGGQNNYVKVYSEDYAWLSPVNVDVSSLTNGTVYDGVVYLQQEYPLDPPNNWRAYLYGVTLIGSE